MASFPKDPALAPRERRNKDSRLGTSSGAGVVALLRFPDGTAFNAAEALHLAASFFRRWFSSELVSER